MSKSLLANKARNGYALFDLDQTLAPWDMQLLFANWVFHKHPLRRIYLVFFLICVPFTKILGARRLKRLFLAILHRMPAHDLDQLCREFSDHYCPKIFYPEIVELLEQQQAQGRLCVLTSASPFLYVRYIGEKLGFDYTFGTMVTTPKRLPLIPEIIENNKSEVKTKRLRYWLDQNGVSESFPLPNSTAYTDSSADLPLIEITENAVLVHPSESLESMVKDTLKKPYKVFTPTRPFHSDWGHFTSAVKKLLGLYPI